MLQHCHLLRQITTSMQGSSYAFSRFSVAGLVMLVAGACNGFGDFQAGPPSGFAYSGSPFVFTDGAPITPAKPTINGSVTSCVSSPALPSGLVLDQTSCTITGTPAGLQPPTGYNITAANKVGSASTTISIEVNQNPPASLVYAGNPFTFTQGASIGSVAATFTGSATGCVSAPALPPGLSINATTCEITGIPTTAQVATAYTITVSNAFGSANAGINIAVNAESTPPSTPTAFNASPISGTQIDLTWVASTDNFSAQGNLIYEICRVTGTGGCTAFTVTHTTGAGAVSFSSTGLTAGTVYYFVIRARDEANNFSIASGEISVMTTPAGTVSNPTFAPPAGLYNITQNVSLSVAAPAASTICYTTNGTDPACDGTKLACSAGTLYSAAVSVSATSTVKAIGCKPTYTDSTIANSAYTIDAIAPATPTAFNASPISTSQIDLTWAASSDNISPTGNIIYEICRATTPGGCATFSATHTTAAGATTFSSTGLNAGTTYFFVIRARDEATNLSTVSGEISAVTTPVGTVSNPVFSPPAGTYNAAQNVTITVASPASPTICYSTNGVDPSCDIITKLTCTSGSSYSGPVSVAAGQTLKAVGCKLLYADSAITSGLYTVDATAPQVTNVTSSTADGTYNTGATISIQVIFTEPVIVTGTPVLSLATGSPATTPVNYVSGTGTNTLTFDYLVANGNTTNDLEYASTAALSLAGGSIQDAVGNNAVLPLAAPGAAGSISASKAFNINPPPNVLSVSPINGATNWSVTDPITVTFDQNMNTGLIVAQGANGACSGTFWVSVDGFATCLGGTMAYPTQSSATFTPSSPFCVESNYPVQVRMLTAVQSATGVPLTGQFDSTNNFSTQQALLKVGVTTGSDVRAFAVHCNTLFVAGAFTELSGAVSVQNLAAINLATGFARGGGFVPPGFGADAAINALAIAGNELVIGGNFLNAGGAARSRIASFNVVTGVLGATAPTVNGPVNAIAVEPPNKIYVGGDFTTFAGQPRTKLAAVMVGTASAEPTWNPAYTGTGAVLALAFNVNRVFVGGSFTGGNLGGTSANYLGAVNNSTGVNAGWCGSGASAPVESLAVSGGNVYMGGSFGSACTFGFNRYGAVSATTAGTIGFNLSGTSGNVSAIALTGTTAYAAGMFNGGTGFFASLRNYAGATNLTGTVNAWDPNLNGNGRAVYVLGSAIILGGLFTSVNGSTAVGNMAIVDATTGAYRP